ncbi:hypothetical protein IFT48_00970 [Pseudomonas fluorescens]|uniref:hypothetical protein n=1 Tax=Pseudomonas TaxID=286 RepID=UPI000F01704C|nr:MULTISPECIES: hypothetical protein [Pseudomonas]MBD8088564.1 hypothetical protein [Pseudomonas fluorescens]MBD8614975.1 hypothetical protein [Pseudomonas putida]MBD8681342.1 hypothetical protein [Pseudomonas sp. CFBP 13719]
MKKLVERYPALFGAVLMLGIACSLYLVVLVVGMGVVWFLQHFQDSPVQPAANEADKIMNLLFATPLVGILSLVGLFVGVIAASYVGRAALFCLNDLATGSYAAAQRMGRWLAKRMKAAD